jgi:hypothetical protein
MSKLKSIATAATGAAVAYWMDPENGAGRRARAVDQLAARWRDLISAASRRIEYRKGLARGLMHHLASAFRRDREFDDAVLIQKVRSEALGPWLQRTGNTGDVRVTVEGGEVTVAGSVESPDRRETLLRLIENVEGVRSVTDRLVSTEMA